MNEKSGQRAERLLVVSTVLFYAFIVSCWGIALATEFNGYAPQGLLFIAPVLGMSSLGFVALALKLHFNGYTENSQ